MGLSPPSYLHPAVYTSCYLLKLQGAKILLLGDSRAFLALYSVIQEAKLTAFQLDRADQAFMIDAKSRAGILAEAMACADCLLLSYQQLCLPEFPLQMFSCAVEYAPEAFLDQGLVQTASEVLGKHKKLHWVAFIAPQPATGLRDANEKLDAAAEQAFLDTRPQESAHGTQWYEDSTCFVATHQIRPDEVAEEHSQDLPQAAPVGARTEAAWHEEHVSQSNDKACAIVCAFYLRQPCHPTCMISAFAETLLQVVSR